MSIGTPTKQASRPFVPFWVGSRIIVAGPPKRGISLPPKGWLNFCVIALPIIHESSSVAHWAALREGSDMAAEVAIVVGVGPGLGSSLVQCFAGEGMTVVAGALSASGLAGTQALTEV